MRRATWIEPLYRRGRGGKQLRPCVEGGNPLSSVFAAFAASVDRLRCGVGDSNLSLTFDYTPSLLNECNAQ